MTTKQKFEICIIGAGAGGLSVAAGASQLGIKVALIENNRMGGDCLNYGCVPSKALLSIAKHYHAAVNSAYYGFKANPDQVQLKEIMLKVKEAIKHIQPHDSAERFNSLGTSVIAGSARFISESAIMVGDNLIAADYFVVATGSHPFIPDIPGLDSINYLTNESIFDLDVMPEHLVIIGGGPIGCEMAQAFAMLGAKVTIIEQGPILAKEDPELVSLLRAWLRSEHPNLTIRENSLCQAVTTSQGKLTAIIRDNTGTEHQVLGSHLLVASGRRPNLGRLDLAKAGVYFNDRGIMVNQNLRTSNKRIYAIGDVTGGLQYTDIAGYHAGIVIRNILFRQKAKVNYQAVPRVTYTTPELAHVGLSPFDLVSSGDNYVLSEFAFSDNDRAVTDKQLVGKIKLYTNKRGKVLGVSILGPNAGELLAPWIDLINRGDSVRALTKNIIPYPTYSDINKQVVGEYYKPILFSPRVKRLVKFLKIFW